MSLIPSVLILQQRLHPAHTGALVYSPIAQGWSKAAGCCAGDPVQWTLRGLITSQLGNVEYPLVQLAAGGALTPKEFIFYQVQYSARNVLLMLAPPSGVGWCLCGARSFQPHGVGESCAGWEVHLKPARVGCSSPMRAAGWRTMSWCSSPSVW